MNWVIYFASKSRDLILLSPPEAEMKLNQNVTQTNEKRDHMASLCSFVISEMGHGVPLVVVLHCCVVFCRSEEDSEDESLSHGGRQNHDNLYRVHMPSLYSCGSSYGSETSIPAAAHTVSNAPVTEYM